jgi:hypothetical protein
MAEEVLSVYVVPVTTLEDEELAAAAGSTSAAFQELLPDSVDAQEFAGELTEGRDRLFAAGVKILKNPETGNKLIMDQIRDKRFLGFRSRIEHLTYSEDTAIAADAVGIMDKIRQRGYSLHNEGLKKQTSLMDGLINDLKESSYRDILVKIDAMKEFESMVQAEAAFHQSESNFTKAGITIENPSLLEARKFVRKIIEECNSWLCRRLRRQPEMISPMVVRWNEIMTQLTAEAKGRSTRKNGEKEAAGEVAAQMTV